MSRICYATGKSWLLNDTRVIVMACKRTVPDSDASKDWTTARAAVTCAKCKRTAACRQRSSAGGIHVTGDAPPPPFPRPDYFGAASRKTPLSRTTAFREWLGPVVAVDPALIR